MKILANENVPLASVTYLKSNSFDIKSIGTDNPSISDNEVMKIAINENRVILTYDSDYGELIFKYGYKPTAGVIFIRNQPKDPLETARMVEDLLKKEISFEKTLTVVDGHTIRQKKY